MSGGRIITVIRAQRRRRTTVCQCRASGSSSSSSRSSSSSNSNNSNSTTPTTITTSDEAPSVPGTRSFPAIYARGGTSKGLLVQRCHLPPEDQWHTVLPAAMGSPDPVHGRQLDGLGGASSSTSKFVVLSPAARPDADVAFTFVQIGVRDGVLDTAGNCGNMSAAVGPVSLDQGLVAHPLIVGREDKRTALVRIFNTNTSKMMHARFPVVGDPPRYWPDGDYAMDGVPGTGSRVTLRFLDPAGAKTRRGALPTGRPVDVLTLPDGSEVEASLVDVSNPGVFVRVDDLGFSAADVHALDPVAVEANPALKFRLEQIRRAGAVMMGLNPRVESVPKIVMVFSPGVVLGDDGLHLRCLALSMGQAHRAVPLTLALCLGAAAKLAGTIPHQLVVGDVGNAVVIGHPGGRVEVGTTVRDGHVVSAELHRTARVLMKGKVFY